MTEIEKVDNVELTINGCEYIKDGKLLNPYIPNLISLNHFNLKTILEKKYNTQMGVDIKSSIKMVNSNAYELREMILKNSIDVVLKYSKSDNLDNIIDDIMKTSEKFYDFVENKRKC